MKTTRIPEQTILRLSIGVMTVLVAAVAYSLVSRFWPMAGATGTASLIILGTLLFWAAIAGITGWLAPIVSERWPDFYDRWLAKKVYLTSTAHARLKHPPELFQSVTGGAGRQASGWLSRLKDNLYQAGLRSSEVDIPYAVEHMRSYPLEAWIDVLSFRQLLAFKTKHGVLEVNPYIQGVLYRRLAWVEKPSPGMKTGFETLTGDSIDCGDKIEVGLHEQYDVTWERSDWHCASTDPEDRFLVFLTFPFANLFTHRKADGTLESSVRSLG